MPEETELETEAVDARPGAIHQRDLPLPASGGRLDGVWIAVFALLAYLALGQEAFYKIDGQVTLERIARGWIGHGSHLMADAWARVFRDLVAPLGWTLYESVVAFSAASTAASLVPLHLAARSVCTRQQAALACGLFAVAPAVVFYASVVEFHGPFLAFASLAFLAATKLGAAPTARRAFAFGVLAGLLSSFSQLAHSSGAILPALLVPWVVVVARNTRHARAPLFVIAASLLASVAIHWLMLRGWPSLLRALEILEPKPGGRSALAGQDYLAAHLDTLEWTQARFAWITLVYEWLWPFATASLLAFARPTLRWGRSALTIALMPYLGIAFLLMRHENEFGAYVMPCAWLACILAARAYASRTLLACCSLAGLAAVSTVWLHDRDAKSAQYKAAFATVEAKGPAFVISGSEDERHYALMHLRHAKAWPQVAPAEELVVHVAAPDLITGHIEKYAKAGFVAVITRAASRTLDASAAGRIVRALLERHFDWEPTAQGALEGWYLVRKR